MTFLAPAWLFAAFAAAAVVVGLHLFARRRPTAECLPTARFIPPHSAQATTRTVRPTDLLLLLLRVLLLLAVGAALAQPVLNPRRGQRARIILADVSRSTPSLELLLGRLAVARRAGDIVIPFDSAPRAPLAEGVAPTAVSKAQGSLTSALIAAHRTRRELGARTDSVDLTIISAVGQDEMDHATAEVRDLWPGRITVERLEAATRSPASARVQLQAGADDPLLATVRLRGTSRAFREVRIVRSSTVAAADSAWASNSGSVLVHWPAVRAVSAAAAASVVSAPSDTVVGLAIGNIVVVSPLARTDAPDAGTVIARWADGAPAASERSASDGCIRHVAVTLPAKGDLPLRADFGRFVDALTAPCASDASGGPASDTAIAQLVGAGGLAPSVAASVEGARSLAPWLLGLALLLVLVEPVVRRREVRA